MKKLAIVVQRYGTEVNGGAEYHARILAEKLRVLFDVEILTSCALDHATWANEYPEGCNEINGIKVRRFKTVLQRNKKKMHHLANRLMDRSLLQKALRFTGIKKWFSPETGYDALGEEWMKQQGPFVPGLISYLEGNEQHYDALIFFTYLYFPAFSGLRVAPHKSILIPTAHDEPPIHFPVFKSFFNLPKAILYNTISEKKLVNQLFHNDKIYSDVVGLGIDELKSDQLTFPQDILPFAGPYVIYIGRVDAGKGCDVMISYFMKYRESTKSDVRLVLVGHSSMVIEKSTAVVEVGFINEELKQRLLLHAEALIIPSRYESLSLVTLESMQAGIPVIANNNCEVLKDHVEQSKAGFTFDGFDSFKAALDVVLNHRADLAVMKDNGRKYVRDHYNWPVVLQKIDRAIDVVTEQ